MTSRLLVAFWLLIFARVAEACSCLPVPVSAMVQRSSDVFIGVVRSRKTSGGVVKGHVFIEKSWKGARAGRTVIVETGFGGGICGVDLWPGQNVLVFAHPGSGHAKGTLSTTLCEGSISWPRGATEIGNVTARTDSLGPPVSVAEAPPK